VSLDRPNEEWMSRIQDVKVVYTHLGNSTRSYWYFVELLKHLVKRPLEDELDHFFRVLECVRFSMRMQCT